MKRALALTLYALALSLAYSMKRFYSGASASELEFSLAPTTWLITKVSGARFFFEEGFGYVSPELRVAVVPGCAGLNFMIVVFLALVFGFMDRWTRFTHQLLFMAACAVTAYALTLVVNAARILGSSLIFGVLEASTSTGFDEVHRVVGVVLYVGALFAVVTALERRPLAGSVR